MQIIGCQPPFTDCTGATLPEGCRLEFLLSICNFQMGGWTLGGDWDRYLSDPACDSYLPPAEEEYPVWLMNQGGGIRWLTPWVDPRNISHYLGGYRSGANSEDISARDDLFPPIGNLGFFGIHYYSAEQGTPQLENCELRPLSSPPVALNYLQVDLPIGLDPCQSERDSGIPCDTYYLRSLFAQIPALS